MSFFKGIHFYINGVRFWSTRRELVTLSFIPWAINFICFSVGMVLALTKLPTVLSLMISQPEIWYQYVAYYALGFVTACALSVLVMFCVYVVAQFLAFPFNDLVSERTLEISKLMPEKPHGFKIWLNRALKNTFTAVKKLVVLAGVAVLLLLSAFVPGLGIFGALLSVFIICWDLMDYAFDHFGESLTSRIHFIKSNIWTILGFCVGLGLTSMIPVINFLLIPAHVSAAAIMVGQLKRVENKVEGPHT